MVCERVTAEAQSAKQIGESWLKSRKGTGNVAAGIVEGIVSIADVTSAIRITWELNAGLTARAVLQNDRTWWITCRNHQDFPAVMWSWASQPWQGDREFDRVDWAVR